MFGPNFQLQRPLTPKFLSEYTRNAPVSFLEYARYVEIFQNEVFKICITINKTKISGKTQAYHMLSLCSYNVSNSKRQKFTINVNFDFLKIRTEIRTRLFFLIILNLNSVEKC